MKQTKAAIKNKVNAYLKKFDEYDNMTLDELIELQKSNKVKGTYYEALINMIKLKQKIATNEIKRP